MTLSALEKSKQWQWALELLSEMSHKSLKPDLTLDQTWCAALNAPCYPWFQWPPHLDNLIILLSLHFNETVFRKPKVGSPWNIGTQRCHFVFVFRPRANHFVGPQPTSSFVRWRGKSMNSLNLNWWSFIGLSWSSMFGLLATEHPCWVYTADVCDCSKDMPQHRLGLDDASWMFAVKGK